MAKYLTPSELAEIVTGLLVNPTLLGELESSEVHASFMADIGRTVCQYCGGDVVRVSPPETPQGDDNDLPMLHVSPNASLPSLNQNVWAVYGPDSWVDEQASEYGIEVGQKLTPSEASVLRTQLRSLFTPSASTPLAFTHSMVDWRIIEDTPVDKAGDEAPISVKTHLGNQPSMELFDQHGNPLMGIIVEVNLGVPALHIDVGGDALLHFHAAHDGLVITPERYLGRFEQAPLDRYSYNQGNSYLVK